MKLRRTLCSFLIVVILSVQCDIPVKANSDYLNITLADIVVTYFNATGVAIGEAELFNAIYDLWGNVTLENLIDNGVLVGSDASWSKEDIKEMLGYGNLSAPFIKVKQSALKSYLGEIPISSVAYDALNAMFSFDNPVTDGIFTALSIIIGDVANIGKIGYDMVSGVVEDISGVFPIGTLKQAYQKFTDSAYFQDLLHTEDTPEGEYTIIGAPEGYDGYGGIVGVTNYIFFVNEHCFPVMYGKNSGARQMHWRVYNCTDSDEPVAYGRAEFDGNTITVTNLQYATVSAQGYYNPNFSAGYSSSYPSKPVYGYCLNKVGQSAPTMETACLEDPWGSSGDDPDQPGGTGNGVTNYINNSVGNIASDNYINLSPNIGAKEYLTIFDRVTYIENLNQITENTDNGNYSQNSTVINNYNNQYIQNTIPVARPSTVPAENPENQPAQPFVSPRPTQTPEFVETVVQEGGLSEEITTKFPFCIPWDIKALIDNLWAPEARAPYIHWEATFGEWGKLGEVTLDFSEFDPAARIFRSTTLLLWIVGLVLITRNLIG